MSYDAVILAGGQARRLGGIDKPMLVVDGRSLLDRVLDAVDTAARRIVVGPPRPLPAGVLGCREDPPGGGPLAGLAVGVSHTGSDVVVVLAADLPWVAPAVPRLIAAVEQAGDVAALASADGRRNPLAAAWRRASLIAALRRVGDPVGVAVRQLYDGMVVQTVPDPAGWGTDCDTPADLAAAQRADVR